MEFIVCIYTNNDCFLASLLKGDIAATKTVSDLLEIMETCPDGEPI